MYNLLKYNMSFYNNIKEVFIENGCIKAISYTGEIHSISTELKRLEFYQNLFK